MTHLDRTAIPGNVLDRLEEVERRLDDLVGYAAMPTIDPESGEGETTYVEILKDIQEGPDIVVTASGTDVAVGRAGDTILLFDSGGDPLREYAFTDAGLIAGLAAMAAGDKLKVRSGTISGGPWTLAYGTLEGAGADYGTILEGQLTVGDATVVDSLKIYRSEDEVGVINGVVEGAGGILATLRNVIVEIENATGPANCIFIENGGEVRALKSDLIAEIASVGYVFYITSGKGKHRGGLALGTDADKKFYWY